MAKVVTCPSCQTKGSIPDDSKAARIKCPKCNQMFDVKGASTGQSSASIKKPGSSAKPKPAAPRSAAFEDLDSVEPLPPVAASGSRRAAGAPARGQSQGSGQSPMLYVVLGVGSVAVLLVCGLLFAVLMRGNGNAGQAAAAPASAASAAEVVQTTPASTPVQQVAAAAPIVAPTVAAAAPVDTAGSFSNTIDSVEVVRRLKDATVYIKNTIGGRTFASGSGFVIKVIGENTILATNRHVIDVDSSELPPGFVPEGAKVGLEVVFRSGLGSQKEKTYPAVVIAADSTGDISNDLAFLVVKNVAQPPTPINFLTPSDTTEGMAYTGSGFPFGGILSKVNESKGNPSVTVTRGGISRLVRDDHGHVDLFQVDGSLQPGNSGGPIVEEKTGKFIGVVVAKLGPVDTIGFVVPAEEVRRAFDGRIGALDLTMSAISKDSADLQIKAQIVDPEGVGVRDIIVLAASASSAGAIAPKSDGTWPPLPNAKSASLERDTKVAMAAGNLRVSLSGEGAAARKVLLQTAFKDRKGKLILSKPREFELPEKPGRIRPPGLMERLVKNARPKSYKMLTKFVDKSKDCKYSKDDKTMEIKIDVPGDKVHTLATYAVSRNDKAKSLHNAPMLLADLDGDFVAMVTVTGEMSPGGKLPKDRQGNNLPFTFSGAGLLLYQDKDNFVRLERTAGIAIDSLQAIHKVLIEIVKDGKHLDTTNVYWPLKEGDVQLQLVRRKGKAKFAFKEKESPVTFFSREFELDLPKKVQLGLSASNISAKAFTASFDDFAIINDTTIIDEEFSQQEKKPTDGSEPKGEEKKSS